MGPREQAADRRPGLVPLVRLGADDTFVMPLLSRTFREGPLCEALDRGLEREGLEPPQEDRPEAEYFCQVSLLDRWW